jgi:hypothetical protein
MNYKKKTQQAPEVTVPDREQYIVTDKIEANVNNRSINAVRGDRIMLNTTEVKVLARSVLKL